MKYRARIALLIVLTALMCWSLLTFYRAITTPTVNCYVQRSGYCGPRSDNP